MHIEMRKTEVRMKCLYDNDYVPLLLLAYHAHSYYFCWLITIYLTKKTHQSKEFDPGFFSQSPTHKSWIGREIFIPYCPVFPVFFFSALQKLGIKNLV